LDQFAAAGHDVQLRIAGDGPERERLSKQIAASRYSERMELCGHVFDMNAFFEQLDVFVLSSLREGLPNVLLEAMAMELPIVATRCGGLAEFVGTSDCVLLCDPGEPTPLHNLLESVIRSTEVRERLSNAAAQHIRRFSFQERAKNIAEIYRRLL
jgi:glycosyltransferase involved in cell wall biosynthesis